MLFLKISDDLDRFIMLFLKILDDFRFIRATKVYSVLILHMERFIFSFLERRGFICVAGYTGED